MANDPSANDFDRHLKTDTLRSELKKRSLLSGAVNFAAQPLKLIIGIGSTAVLARLLTPAEFGLVAMATPLLTFVDSLSNFGLETAIVHREKLDRAQANVIFWLSLKINALIIGLMMLMGPVLSWFYGETELTGITLVMAIGASSLCLAFQHKSLLKRQMRFGTLTAIDVWSLFAGAVVAIGAAWLDLGYWALVLQLVVVQLNQSLFHWLVCDWRPVWIRGAKLDADLRAMLSFGAHLTGFRFLTRIGMRLDRILVGYVGGAGVLGLYDAAYRWAYTPFDQIYNPLFDVAVSSFSRAYENPERYRTYCRNGLTLLYTLCMPALAFLFVEAREVLLLLMGSQWLEAAPLLQILTVAVFVGSLYRVTKWLYVSAGQTQQQFRWGLIHTPIMIVAVAIGAKWGAYGVAVGYATALCLLTYPSVAFCLKNSPFTLGDFVGAAWRPALSSIMAAAVLFISRSALPNFGNIVFELALKSTLFGVTYGLLWIILPGGRQAIVEILQNLKALGLKRKGRE